MSLEEHLRAKETMSRFQKGGEGSEILVPVGANSFLFAQISNPNKAIVGIGSDLTVEEDMKDAIKRMDGKIEEIETALKGLTEKVVEVSRMVEEKSAVVRDLYDQVQQRNE